MVRFGRTTIPSSRLDYRGMGVGSTWIRYSRRCSPPPVTWNCVDCRNCFAAFVDATAQDPRSILWPVRPKHGQRCSFFDHSGRAWDRIRSGRKSDPLPQSTTPPFVRSNCIASTSAERRNGRYRTQGLRIACFYARPAKHRSHSSFDDCQLNA